ncbi:cytochrome oxidase c assembly-domain-containing protein [Xylaria flabelliformis]|nr:cytochrome oxidase c assembly-domain-containing protein [Xylaria flabelliformis]
MAARNSSSSPRSVADATRFTSNRPHANTKSSPNIAASASAAQQRQKQQQTLPRRGGGAGAAAIPQQETMEERVRRLRAAHLAAKQHSVSRMDKVIGGSRRLFDAAHKFTVMGLIGFSGIALLVTVYATADMMMYNRKRRNEFFSLQKQLKEDSLEAARLAYMTGTASEEQIALVEDATAKAKEAGIALPSILSAPQSPAPAGGRETTSTTAAGEEEKKGGGVTGWLFGGLKKEDDAQAADDGWRSTSTNTTENVADTFRDKAKAAFENERDNQRRGGTLDQVGLDTASAEGSGKKKGWW